MSKITILIDNEVSENMGNYSATHKVQFDVTTDFPLPHMLQTFLEVLRVSGYPVGFGDSLELICKSKFKDKAVKTISSEEVYQF